MRSAADSNLTWLESLSPWPEEFGLGRMRELLKRLRNPERRLRAIHVVGTNGKTTTTRMTEALLAAEGLRVGSYTSPHVVSWTERLRVGGEEADLEAALGRVRAEAEAVEATQFEALTAAALAELASAEVDVAVVEAGLGGRHDATNVLDAGVVVLTNVALEHVDVLGPTREAIAGEKLAVISPGALVVIGEAEWEGAARAAGASAVTVVSGSSAALAHAAA
jgi:dihydrofolate synthase/folylpolyglutamate synthase